MRRLADSVGIAAGETGAIARDVAALDATARRIEKIVDAIALVAVQTNMLAVSGAVEAARAGASGQGFSIVSADIRALARDSAANADRMKDVMRDIRDQIAIVRAEMEQLEFGARGETGRQTGSLERLDQVETEMDALRDGASEVLRGADSVLGTVREVLAGTERIASTAAEASDAAGEATTAARQQARGAEDLAAAIEEIASLADELRASVV